MTATVAAAGTTDKGQDPPHHANTAAPAATVTAPTMAGPATLKTHLPRHPHRLAGLPSAPARHRLPVVAAMIAAVVISTTAAVTTIMTVTATRHMQQETQPTTTRNSTTRKWTVAKPTFVRPCTRRH